jgi:hypothetical protein
MIKPLFFTFVIALISSAQARADFTDYYAFPRHQGATAFSYTVNQGGSYTFVANNWSISSSLSGWNPSGGPGSPYVTATDSQLLFSTGSPFGVSGVSSSLSVSTTAPAAGFWSFDFTLALSDPHFYASRGGYYFINGTGFALPQGSGTIDNIFLNAGDVFGFGVHASRAQQGVSTNASLTITNFSAPVPEAQPFVLLLIGAGLFAFCYGRRQRI